ncbi:hypothetical protein V8D89_003633 [Ganoderma adspersum]
MKLTYDALLHVISVTASVKESVKLMATCRVLYHEGAKIALRKPITIFNEGQLVSFLRFLRAEDLSRCRHLRQLELWSFDPELDGLPVLIETLPHLVNLELLQLPSAEELLELHLFNSAEPALLPAFAALTSLRHVEISEAKGATCRFLSSLQSPLVSLRIDFFSDDDITLWDILDTDGWSKYHPTVLLANFAPTLKELQCIAWYTNGNAIYPEKVYPNMRRLSIVLHEFPLRIDPFIRAFPYLTDLRVNTDYHENHYSEAIRESHETNVAQQLDPLNSCGAWAHLEHFSGTLVDLYAIGLTSHIPRVTLIDTLRDGPRVDVLATVLRYARPVHLKLEGITGTMLGDAERGFISVLRERGGANLSNLDMSVKFGSDDQEKDLAAVMADLFSSLGRVPLKFLELSFDTHQLDPTPRPNKFLIEVLRLPEPPEPTPAPLTPAELSLNALDTNVLVTRMADSLTTLEAAHVVVLGSPRRGVESFERTVVKGTSQVPGSEQWHSWSGNDGFLWNP